MEDIFPLKLRDWYICEEVEEEQVEKKEKVDAFQLDRGGKERWAKVCKQRRCVHGRLHPHYFRPKKFFPICLWNQLPVKSLLSTLLPQRAHLPSRLDLESRERNCERVATDFSFLCVLGEIFSLLADKLTNRFSICSLHIHEMLLRPRRKACLSAFSTVFKVSSWNIHLLYLKELSSWGIIMYPFNSWINYLVKIRGGNQTYTIEFMMPINYYLLEKLIKIFKKDFIVFLKTVYFFIIRDNKIT